MEYKRGYTRICGCARGILPLVLSKSAGRFRCNEDDERAAALFFGVLVRMLVSRVVELERVIEDGLAFWVDLHARCPGGREGRGTKWGYFRFAGQLLWMAHAGAKPICACAYLTPEQTNYYFGVRARFLLLRATR
jgi:hypothetical protein